MHVLVFSGFSGAGKTTLIERLIARFDAAGERVSVVKHAHHDFDIDHEGKDTWRHRRAGAYEVVVASDRRFAKMREYPVETEPVLDELLAELDECDWAFVEGFRHIAMPKIEVWRAGNGKQALYPEDPHVIAVATDRASALPVPTGLPVLKLDAIDAIADFIRASRRRCEYLPAG